MTNVGAKALPVLIVLLLAPAWAPALYSQDLTSILARSNFSTSQRGEVESDFKSYSSMGVPQEMLLPRLEEGIAKRVPFAILVSVLKHTALSLNQARRILLSQPEGSALMADRGAWSVSGTLLDAGASADVIAGIAQASGGKGSHYRFSALLYEALVSWGLSTVSSLQVAEAAARSRVAPENYPGIVDLFAQGRAMSIPPEGVAARVLAELPQARTFDDLRRNVLY